ncbi:MAG TPA: sugar kinase [bacterium]|nr:sugar kinase [bacterium]
MPVVIVGSMAFDTIETPREKRERVIGGACVYASIAASVFTGPRIVGVVGEDFTDVHFRILKDRGIDTRGVKREKGKSFFWAGKYHENMCDRDTIVTELNVFEKFDPELPDDYKETPFLFLANIDPPLQLKVLNMMKKPIFSLCDTMNLWINIKKKELLEVFSRVDCVVLNDAEAAQLTGKAGSVEAAKELQKIGPKYVIIKKGENGAAIFGPQGKVFVGPAYPVACITDPTGAGDSFAGAFIGYLASKKSVSWKDLKRALVYGNAAASFTVEGFSTEAVASASRKDIEERLKQIKEMSAF